MVRTINVSSFERWNVDSEWHASDIIVHLLAVDEFDSIGAIRTKPFWTAQEVRPLRAEPCDVCEGKWCDNVVKWKIDQNKCSREKDF